MNIIFLDGIASGTRDGREEGRDGEGSMFHRHNGLYYIYYFISFHIYMFN